MSEIRKWVLKLLAGKSLVVLNARFINGTLTFHIDDKHLLHNCSFNGGECAVKILTTPPTGVE